MGLIITGTTQEGLPLLTEEDSLSFASSLDELAAYPDKEETILKSMTDYMTQIAFENPVIYDNITLSRDVLLRLLDEETSKKAGIVMTIYPVLFYGLFDSRAKQLELQRPSLSYTPSGLPVVEQKRLVELATDRQENRDIPNYERNKAKSILDKNKYAGISIFTALRSVGQTVVAATLSDMYHLLEAQARKNIGFK